MMANMGIIRIIRSVWLLAGVTAVEAGPSGHTDHGGRFFSNFMQVPHVPWMRVCMRTACMPHLPGAGMHGHRQIPRRHSAGAALTQASRGSIGILSEPRRGGGGTH